MKRITLTLIVLLALFVPAMAVSASTTYYVRPDGSDGNDGLSNDAAGAWLTIQYALDTVAPGDTIQISAGTYAGGLIMAVDSVNLVGEPGVVVTGGSPAVAITSDHATLIEIEFDGEGTHPADSGIVVADGVSMLWIERCQVYDWGVDGITTLGALTGLKLVDSYLAGNGSDGCEFALVPGGPLSIYGNSFRDNAGFGINNADPAPACDLVAEYNEWGHLDGPASGDGVSSGVDADPWVFAKLWVDPSPTTVREGEAFSAQVKMDVHHLYGAEFDMTVDTGLFQLTADPVFGAFETTAEGSAFRTNGMADINSSGVLELTGYRALPDAEYDAADDTLLTVDLQAQEIATSEETGHLQFVSASVRMAAVGGVNILIDSVACGNITVLGTTSVDGLVDLQGRSDDSGAVADAAPGGAHGWDPAADTCDAWGNYAFADMTDDTYDVTIEMPRYLDASATVAVSGDTQSLPQVKLLGGDADDSDEIDISDVSIIGGQYGNSGGTLADHRADINADDKVDIQDLVLAAGNYQLTESPWTL